MTQSLNVLKTATLRSVISEVIPLLRSLACVQKCYKFKFSLPSGPWKHLKPAFIFSSWEYLVFSIPNFPQSFNREFFCYPPFTLYVNVIPLGGFSCGRNFLFRITSTVSFHPSARTVSTTIIHSFAGPFFLFLTITESDPFLLNVFLVTTL